MRKNIALLIIIILTLGALAGCNNDATKGEGNGNGVQKYVFSSSSPVLGLNPILNTTAPDNGLHAIILETLIARVADENNNSVIKPAAAESWGISEDGTVYTFKIRENAVWNDGFPVTAHDFVYSFRQMATPSVGSTNAWLFDGIIVNFGESLYNSGDGDSTYNKQPEDIGVKALDDKTVEFTLVKPYAYFLDLLDGAKPIRQDKYEEWGSEYGSSFDKVVTNGAFVIESWDQNIQMTLVKNENYWDADNVKLEVIERKVISDPAVAVQALISGEIDVVSTNDPDWQALIKREGERFRVITTESRAPEFMSFNASNKYFRNPKIRLAFSLSFDREKYVNDLREGIDTPLYSMIPSNINVGEELYTERVGGRNEIIKDLLKEYSDPKKLLIEGLIEEGFDPDPSKMKVRLATRGTAEFSKRSSEWMLQQWKENLGVSITIDMMEWNIMWDKVAEGDYDIATAGWGPYYNDPNGLLSIYHPVNGYFNSQKTGWDGPDAKRFVELLEKAGDTADNQEKAEIYLEAEKLLVGTGLILPTYVSVGSTFIANYIQGYYVNTHSYVDYTKIYIEGR